MVCVGKQLLGVGWGTYLDMIVKNGLAKERLLKPEAMGWEEGSHAKGREKRRRVSWQERQ